MSVKAWVEKRCANWCITGEGKGTTRPNNQSAPSHSLHFGPTVCRVPCGGQSAEEPRLQDPFRKSAHESKFVRDSTAFPDLHRREIRSTCQCGTSSRFAKFAFEEMQRTCNAPCPMKCSGTILEKGAAQGAPTPTVSTVILAPMWKEKSCAQREIRSPHTRQVETQQVT